MNERERFFNLHSDLEAKLRSAREFNENLQMELEKVRDDRTTSERDLRSQIDAITSRTAGDDEWKGRYEALEKSNEDLRSELSRQEEVTNEVRKEMTDLLSSMKALSERSSQSFEREENLVIQLQRLENESKEWKSRYARLKAQPRTARSTSTTISVQQPDTQGIFNGSFTIQDGLITDVHVTRFQIAIDELLRSARSGEPQSALPHVKNVVVAVRNIILDLGDTQSNSDEATHQRHVLKVKVSATANNLITAAKNFAVSQGLSPVSLLDAAASNLTASIIGLVRVVKLRPSPAEESEDDGNSDIVDSPADYYGISNDRSSIGGDSRYSTNSIPQLKQRAFSGSNQRMPVSNGAPNGVPPKHSQGGYDHQDSRIDELRVRGHLSLSRILKGLAKLTYCCRISSILELTIFSRPSKPLFHPYVHQRLHQTSSTPSNPSPQQQAKSYIRPLKACPQARSLAK